LREKPEKSQFQMVLEDVQTACEKIVGFQARTDNILDCATKIYIAKMQKEGEQK
jgi:hypothetical protein